MLSVAFLSCVVVHLMCISREFTPWVQSTVGSDDGAVVGYSTLVDGDILHRENRPFLDHTMMYLGGSIPTDFYVARAVYTFLASSFAWTLGLRASLLLVNIIGWGLAVLLTFLAGREICRMLESTSYRIGAPVAAALPLIAPAFWFHLTDLSAHLWSFTAYYAGVFVILRSRLWARSLPMIDHALIGAVLATALLTYNTSVALLLVYIVAAVMGGNRLLHTSTTAAVALTYTISWPTVLNIFAKKTTDYRAVEARYLTGALGQWRDSFSGGTILGDISGYLSEFALSDLLWFSAGAIAVLNVMCRFRSDWRLLLVLLGLWLGPVALSLVWAPAAGARGYVGTQGQIIAFIAIGFCIGSMATNSWPWRVAVAFLLAAVTLQGLMLRATAAGNPFPFQNYKLGLTEPPPTLRQLISTDTLSVVDSVGRQQDGVAGILAATDLSAAARKTSLRQRRLSDVGFSEVARSGLLRLYVSLPMALLMFGWCLCRASEHKLLSSRRTTAVAAICMMLVLMVSFGPPALAAFGSKRIGYTVAPILVETDLPIGSEARISIELSEHAKSVVAERCGGDVPAWLGLQISRPQTTEVGRVLSMIRIRVNGELLAAGVGIRGLHFSCERLVQALRVGRHVEISVRPLLSDLTIAGWQESDAPRRQAENVTSGKREPMEIVPAAQFLIYGQAKLRAVAVLY